MLTLEQIAEGRAITDAPQSYQSWQDGADFFRDHGKALLDAAERVARANAQVAAVREGIWTGDAPVDDDPHVGVDWAEVGRTERENEARAAAQQRAAELEAECLNEFRLRPLVARGTYACNPHAFGPEHVEAWYTTRGVRVRAEPDPCDPSRLRIHPIEVLR